MSKAEPKQATYPVHQIPCIFGNRGSAADQLQQDHPEREGVCLDVHEALVPRIRNAVDRPAIYWAKSWFAHKISPPLEIDYLQKEKQLSQLSHELGLDRDVHAAIREESAALDLAVSLGGVQADTDLWWVIFS